MIFYSIQNFLVVNSKQFIILPYKLSSCKSMQHSRRFRQLILNLRIFSPCQVNHNRQVKKFCHIMQPGRSFCFFHIGIINFCQFHSTFCNSFHMIVSFFIQILFHIFFDFIYIYHILSPRLQIILYINTHINIIILHDKEKNNKSAIFRQEEKVVKLK